MKYECHAGVIRPKLQAQKEKQEQQKEPYMSSMQGSSITHLFKKKKNNQQFVMNKVFCCSTQ